MLGVGFAMLIFGLIYVAVYKFCKLMFIVLIKLIMLIPACIRKIRLYRIKRENEKLKRQLEQMEGE